jgi:predicted nucleic acid-binding protein
MRGLFDTHMVLDYLSGRSEAAAEFAQYAKPLISVISIAELQLAVNDQKQAQQLTQFLSLFEVVPLQPKMALLAGTLKKQYPQLKLPHACIWASARQCNALLITRNSKNYPIKQAADIRMPY